MNWIFQEVKVVLFLVKRFTVKPYSIGYLNVIIKLIQILFFTIKTISKRNIIMMTKLSFDNSLY